ncbi:retrovirus-related Pol polyprotein from transposon 412 [Trichonephila inaurata madagascariensis]|uniref:RNA-directed DNA polymerase n=1 Tax=Trichonephila inaurata madagascariensis TaxID=2747483 RepID=A0A8X6X5W8_9ARAC|nr:retrovirus-related Pol polyprotein from transposon 412 [Trichonephila inaurata madagascariensis]
MLAVLPAELSNMLAREPTERANNYDFAKDLILKREPAHEKNHEKDFEKRRQLRCYECGSYSHLRPQCDKLKKTPKSISHVVTNKSFDELMARYTSLGKVNGVEMKILHDTGATLDLICNKYVKPHMYTNEKVWLRTLLEQSLICLPLAEVELDCEMGHVITKAAVLRDSLDQGRYLMGNKTTAFLEDYKTKEDVQMHMINVMQTRAQKKLLEVENEVQGQSIEQFDEELNDDLSEDEKKSIEEVLPVVKELSVQDLIKTSPKVFVEEQHKSEQLKPLIADAKLNVSKENKYVLEKNMLFFKKRDKNGTERKLLVIPEKLGEQLKTICHEGAEKTKDALFKTFFWPNCYSDVKKFVKTCDYCQRVGKPRDKKKAPLKIVPIISEIFTKLNVDACGPLPVSTSGNKYIVVILDKFGIRVVRSSVRHPQSNPVERMKRTLKRILRVLCLEAGADWEKILPNALFALRTVIHDSTGFSPAELVHGKNLRTSVMLLYEKLTEEVPVESSVVDYVFELINRMKRCQELTILHSKKKQRLWYDRPTVKRQFQPGELVLVIAPSRPNKLSVQ